MIAYKHQLLIHMLRKVFFEEFSPEGINEIFS